VFTASNVGRLLRGDCRYWTVVFEVWSALIVTWAAGVAIHATFHNVIFSRQKSEDEDEDELRKSSRTRTRTRNP